MEQFETLWLKRDPNDQWSEISDVGQRPIGPGRLNEVVARYSRQGWAEDQTARHTTMAASLKIRLTRPGDLVAPGVDVDRRPVVWPSHRRAPAGRTPYRQRLAAAATVTPHAP